MRQAKLDELICLLEELYHYYDLNRGVGHTAIILNGLKNFKGQGILLTGFPVQGINPQTKVITFEGLLSRPYELKGRNSPIAIDNSFMQKLLPEVVSHLHRLRKVEKELKDLRKEAGDESN